MYIICIETALDENILAKTEVIDKLISNKIVYVGKNIKTNYQKKYTTIPKSRKLLSISLQAKCYRDIQKIMKVLKEFNNDNKNSNFFVHKIINPDKTENILNNII